MKEVQVLSIVSLKEDEYINQSIIIIINTNDNLY